LRNFKKQHLILAKFCTSNVSFIGYQSIKFQSNLFTQTTVTAVFVKSPQNTSVFGVCGWRQTQWPETEVFWRWPDKTTV